MKKEEFYLAVLELQKTKNLATISVRDIANELGISTGLLYYHFENKKQLLNEMFCYLKNKLYIYMKTVDRDTYSLLYRYIMYNKENNDEYRFTVSTELGTFLTENSLQLSKEIHVQFKEMLNLEGCPHHIPSIIFGSMRSLLTAPSYFMKPDLNSFVLELEELINKYQ